MVQVRTFSVIHKITHPWVKNHQTSRKAHIHWIVSLTSADHEMATRV